MGKVNTPIDTNVKFMSINEFKVALGLQATAIADIKRNDKTQKLFMSLNGKNYRVQQAIDSKLPISVLIPSVDASGADIADEHRFDAACLVNTSSGAETVFTL